MRKSQMFWGCLCLAMTTWNQFRSICHFFILVWLSPNTIQCGAIYLSALACVLGKCKCILTWASTIQNREDKWTSRNIAHFFPIPKQIVFELFLSLAQIIRSWLNADMFADDSIGYFGEIGDNMSMTFDILMYPPVEILHKTWSLRSHLFYSPMQPMLTTPGYLEISILSSTGTYHTCLDLWNVHVLPYSSIMWGP